MSARAKIFSILLIGAVLSFQFGCGSSGSGGDAVTRAKVAAVSVVAGSTSIVANGVSQVRITATVTDTDGDAVRNGTTVTFETTAGDFNNGQAGVQSSRNASTTDGVATVMLTSPTNVGFATITATVSGVSDTVTVEFVASSVARIELTADPNNLTADGASISTIAARVFDANGNAVADGETITFRLTGPGSISSPTAQTANGIAAVTYTAGTQLQTATITAESTSGMASDSVNIILIRAVVGSLSPIASSSSLIANGTSQALISVTVRDSSGNLIDDGTAVTFTTTAGTLTSARQNPGEMLSTATINGVARATLTSSTNVGTAVVTITAGGVSTSITFNFVSGSVNSISMTASPTNLSADGLSTSTIRASVIDANNNAIQDGQVISFSITSGTGRLSTPTASTIGGTATVTYTAGTRTGNVVIQAEATNGVSDTVTVVLVRVGVASVNLTAGAAQIVADGSSEATFTASVTDSNGNNVPNGTVVTFSTTAGQFEDPTISTINGMAAGTLISSTNIGTVTVTATAGGVSDTATIQFVAGSPRFVSLTSIPATLTADGVSTAQLRAEVTDAQGNPVANGEVITFYIESGNGTIGPPLTSSTSGGVAFATFTAPTTTGTTRVVAETVTGNKGRTEIAIVAPDVGTITVTANPTSIVADGSSAEIRARVTYANGQEAADGTIVSFTTTAGTFNNGSTTISAATVGGVATVDLFSSTLPETATVTATADDIMGQTDVSFTAVPGFFSITVSQTSVRSDNSNSSTVTVTVLDANRVPVENVTVAFKTSIDGTEMTGGQISSSTAVTDQNGQASIEFRSGTVEKKNQTVDIIASIPSNSALGERIVPIQITGTTISISTANTNLEIDPADSSKASSQMVITVKDAGDVPINNAAVTLTTSQPGLVTLNPSSGQTNINGVLTITVTGTSAGAAAGQVTVTANALGTQNSQLFRIGSVGQVFGITSPVPLAGQDFVAHTTCQDPATCCPDPNADDCGLLEIVVNAPNSASVRFSTTLGFFYKPGGTDAKVITEPVTGGTASAKLYSSLPGTAVVQVFDVADSSIRDTLNVAISAPSSEAATISLQASSTVVAPSSEQIKNTVTLTVTVKTVGGQVVGNAPVAFSIENPTGGGENILPVVVFTDSLGTATTTFTSGFLSSDAQGVQVTATIIDTTISDSIAILIGGSASSIIITRGTQVESIQSNTAYRLPMAVIVSDPNGNPVSGALVTLGAWPINYFTGGWIEVGDECVVNYTSGPIANEDDPGRNLILEMGEDNNGDGQLTPPLSAAGTLPATLVTDDDGVGQFNLIYLKSSAAWIMDEISASTRVLGTETRSTYSFVLPWLLGEECFLPASSYDPPIPEEGSISLTVGNTSLPGNGTSTTSVMATVVDGSGSVVADGEVVTFTLDPSGNGSLSSSTAMTVNGVATVTYTSPGQSGTVTITASTDDGLSDSVTITLTPVVGQVKLASATTTGLVANGSSAYSLTVQVLDLSGQPISGSQVVFTVSGHTGLVAISPLTATTNASGTATTSVTDLSDQDDTMTIRATSGGVSSAPLPLAFTGTGTTGVTVDRLLLASTTTTGAVADGIDSYTVTAQILDPNGVPISGHPITIIAIGNTGLVTINPPVGTSGANGTVTATVTDISSANDGFTVRASSGSKTADLPLSFTGTGNVGATVDEVLLAAPVTNGALADGTDSYTITAQVLDSNGLPMSNQPVTFRLAPSNTSTGLTAFNPPVTNTMANGTAASQVTHISSNTEDVIVRAESGGVSSPTVTLTYTGTSGGVTIQPAAVNVSAAFDTINPTESTTVTATVYDSSGGTIAGVNVLFTLDNPVLGSINSNGVTNSNGQANVTFTARDLAGEVNVTATAGSVSNDPPKTIFILDQTAPANIALTVNPTSIIVQGTATVKATVTDGSMVPVPNGTRVTFVVTNPLFGSVTASAITNAGVAQAAFQAGNTPGTATINVSSGSVTESININIDQSPPSSIEFVSATPNVIAIRQSGGNETSTIQFRVKNSNGVPLEGIDVAMSMAGPNGGEYIDTDATPSQIDVTSNADGIAQVTLHSGFVAGPVTVSATIEISAGPPPVTSTVQSSVVSIGGGVPSEKFFSLTSEFLNIAGLTINNKMTDITAFLADRFGNFNVLTGTTVSFITEAGLAVDTSAVTVQQDGIATITARSQVPAAGSAPEDVAPEPWETTLMGFINGKYGTSFTTHPRDGMCSVLVYTKGEEHFTDDNGNGLFDTGEEIFNTIIDPFIDYNDDNTYTNDGVGGEPDEIFIDSNGNMVWDDETADLGWNSNKNIFGNVKILITGPPIVRFNRSDFTVPHEGSDNVDILICDRNMNPLAPGTTVRITVDAGKVGGRISHDYPNSNVIGPDSTGHRSLIEFPVVISDADPLFDEPETSTLTVEVTWEGTAYRFAISGTVN